MRRRDPRTSLADVLLAGAEIERYLRDRSLADYEADSMLRRAVERQFEIIGEALARALDAEPRLAQRIPEASEAIGLRNVIAHGYDEVVDKLIISTARDDLPGLLDRVRAVLDGEPLR
jgi:uncharacterized protein with HEPN domain